MTKDKKVEDEKELDKEELKKVNGGFCTTIRLRMCPNCHTCGYDSWNKICRNCGYQGR